MAHPSNRLDVQLAAVIGLVALTRVLPHWPNATPVLAIALTGGALYASKRWALVVPLLAMLLSDVALGAMFGWDYLLHGTQAIVYACVAGTVFLGHALRNQRPASIALAGGTAASVGFFLLTNFAVWLGSSIYPQNLQGLIACYGAGLAFYNQQGSFFVNSLVSTWVFSGVILLANAALNRLSGKHIASIR